MRLPPLSRHSTTTPHHFKTQAQNPAPYRKTFSKTCKISPHPGHLTLSKPNNYFYVLIIGRY